jgi:uncharacterized Tic20 family protein
MNELTNSSPLPSTILGPLIMMLSKGPSMPFAAAQARESLVIIAAIRVSDGAPYRYPFSWRLVK